MILDADLPVWSIPPNWSTPIIERLEWLSDVLVSSSGSEQRRGVRLSPRRSFEMVFNPVKGKRTFLDLILHNVGSSEWMLPLFHDKAKLAAAVVATDTRLEFDTRWREFRIGDMAIIMGDTPFSYETVVIDAIDDDGIDLADPLAEDWPKNSVVYPLRRSRIADESNLSALTGTVGQATLLFSLSLSNDYDPGVDPAPTHEGMPIVVYPPDRVDPIETTFQRMAATFDSQTGRAYTYDEAGRAFTVQQYNWQAKGREDQSNLRKIFYRFRGRAKGAWVPTFNDDVILTADVDVGESILDIQRIGYAYTSGIKEGRDRLLFYGPNGEAEVAKINAQGAAPSDEEERLVTLAPLTYAQPEGRAASFLNAARMNQDTIEITHHTDSDGACEATTTFRAFRNARTNPSPIHFPIPISAITPGSCGEGTGTPCNPIFGGWYLRLVMYPSIDPHTETFFWAYHDGFYPNGPGSRLMFGFNPLYTDDGHAIHEYGHPGDPNPILQGQVMIDCTQYGTDKYELLFYYPFKESVWGDSVSFSLHSQYGYYGGWPPPTYGGTMKCRYQYWDQPEVDLGDIGWAGDLWPSNYTVTIPSMEGI